MLRIICNTVNQGKPLVCRLANSNNLLEQIDNHGGPSPSSQAKVAMRPLAASRLYE